MASGRASVTPGLGRALPSTTVPDAAITSHAPAAQQIDLRRQFATARLIAIIAGVLGALAALATPFLPVTQTTATVSWPQQGTVRSIDAPLMSQVPIEVHGAIPCSVVAALPPRG